MNLARKIGRLLKSERLIREGDTVVCAVSGGPDSMVLLHLLHRLSAEFPMKLIAAHVDHSFRGAESERDADVARRFAETLGIPFELLKADVPEYIRLNGLNAQAGAREVRFRFLLETAERNNADAIALAHHLDDQAETVLMHLLGGTSLDGLSGMPLQRYEKKVKLIRPLLRIPKEDILAYAKENRVPYCLDSSNAARKYERNRLRLDIMPKLLAFNARLPYTLGKMADLLRDEEDYMHSQTALLAARILERGEGAAMMSRPLFLAEPVALQRRLIKLILTYLADDARMIDYTKIESIRSAIVKQEPPSLSLDIGAGIRFERMYDQLIWKQYGGISHTVDERTASYAYTLDLAVGSLEVPELDGSLSSSWSSDDNGYFCNLSANGWKAAFDADLLALPLVVRNRRNGDRMKMIGLSGSKKVKDLFIDLKIEPHRRDRIPLIVDGNGQILWIPGIRRSRHALVSASTRRVLLLCYEPDGAE